MANLEKGALKDKVSFLHLEQKRLETAHKNEVSHVNNDKKLKLETQRLASERALNEHVTKVKELQLSVEALEENVARQNEIIASQARKCSKYDDIAAKAVNSNVDLTVCKEKAQLR